MEEKRVFTMEPGSPEHHVFHQAAKDGSLRTALIERIGVGLLGAPPRAILLGLQIETPPSREPGRMQIHLDAELLRELIPWLESALDDIDSRT